MSKILQVGDKVKIRCEDWALGVVKKLPEAPHYLFEVQRSNGSYWVFPADQLVAA